MGATGPVRRLPRGRAGTPASLAELPFLTRTGPRDCVLGGGRQGASFVHSSLSPHALLGLLDRPSRPLQLPAISARPPRPPTHVSHRRGGKKRPGKACCRSGAGGSRRPPVGTACCRNIWMLLVFTELPIRPAIWAASGPTR